MDRKRIIAALFAMNLKEDKASPEALAEILGYEAEEVEREMERMADEGLVEAGHGGAKLTSKGRRAIKVVFVGGGFEVIHYGHAYTLHKAKSLGDVLVVTVARDSTIRKRKNRDPLTGELERVKLLSAMKEVDAAILGVEGDIYVTLEKVKPDIVALGYDQYHLEDEIKAESEKRGMKVEVVRLDSPYPNLKTSRLLEEL